MNRPTVRALPFLAFFVSGVSSLIFQTLWSRLLQHVFGSSSIAISSVVTVFMAGLALGAWLGGRWADRMPRPLTVYALAELVIGVWGLLVPALVAPDGWLADANAWLRGEFGPGTTGFVFARFACIVPILIVPTTLMGATLPLLARHFVAPGEAPRTASVRVGTLYALNTLGAVAGVFLAGFVLMPRIGVARTNLCAAGVNLALGVVVLAFGRRLAPASTVASSANLDEGASVDQAEEAVHPRRVRIAAAIAFALSGFCALLYEVVWSRALVNTVGGSVYSFALILMTFLIGIAGGSALAAWAMRSHERALAGLAVTSVVLSAFAVAPMGLRGGDLGWLGAGVACVLVVLLMWFAATRQRRALAVFGPGATGDAGRWGLAMLGVPVFAAVVLAVRHAERLEHITLSVVTLACVLVALLRMFRARPVALLVALQVFIAGATFVSEIWADELALTFASMVGPLYARLQHSVDRVMAIMFSTVALCILPAALGMGAMFPATMRVWTGGGARIGRDVGAVYTGNTLGSIFGAWLPGFVLMPMIGMQASLHVGVAVNLGLALLVLLAAPHVRNAMRLAAAVGVAALVLLHSVALRRDSPLAWDLTRMTLGAFRIALARDVLDDETWGHPDLAYYRDGLSTTVSVERWGRHYTLKNNGKVEASNGDDMPTQIMVSALPLLLHPSGAENLDVALIGLGSGVTAGAALQFPVRSLEVIELERGVVEASRFFEDVNHLRYDSSLDPPLDTPRLQLIHDDGRNYLAASPKRYDLIISEPSNPWLTGVSDLFTTDHFRIAKRRLAPNGVYCQWVQLYELSPENVKIIYRTFASQFRHVVAFSSEDLSSDTVLLGSDVPLALDLDHVRRAFALPRVAAELERAYVHSPHDVFARILFASRDEIMGYARVESRLGRDGWTRDVASMNGGECPPETCRRDPVTLNTDDNVRIEFAAPRDLIGYERYRGYLETIYSAGWPYGELGSVVTGFAKGRPGSIEYAEQALALLAHGRKPEAAAMLDAAREQGDTPELALAYELWAALASVRGEPVTTPHPPPSDPSIRPEAERRMREGFQEVIDWMARGDHARAALAMDAVPAGLVTHAGPEMRLLRGRVYYKAGRNEDAIDALEQLARDEQEFLLRHPEIHYYLARAHDALLHFDKGVRNMRVYVEARLLAPRSWSEDPPEPPAERAPASDEPGESPKERHDDGRPS